MGEPGRAALDRPSEAARIDELEEKREAKYGRGYKWVVFSNTTLGALMAAIDGSILLISLPAIFTGLGVNPLVPSNISLLLWMLLGYIIISAVLIVSVGRFADTFGRVKLYNIGFVIFAIASILVYASSYLVHGVAGAISIIILRMIQAAGGAFLTANSAAMLTDAFPHNERGFALGTNAIAYAGGSVAGLLVGGFLAAIDWHLIFLISVPVGIAGAIWSYLGLHEIAIINRKSRIDVPGNLVFAAALGLLLISLTYALLPYNGMQLGWGNPLIIIGMGSGFALLAAFVLIELRSGDPMFRLDLFRNRGFSTGMASLFIGWAARWGLQFIMIIWLQGIWLPLHGIGFADTPIMAAIYMLPLTIGTLVLSPISGKLSDKYGPRWLSTSGMMLTGAGLLWLSALPVDFAVLPFLAVTFIIGVGQGIFLSPNIASIMNSLPPEHRGAGSGMRSAFMNVAMMFSMVIFFTLVVAGLSSTLPASIYHGLVSNGVSSAQASTYSSIPATSALFASFLGYNPIGAILPQKLLDGITKAQRDTLTGTEFFPSLISDSFGRGLKTIFYIAAALSFIAAIISALGNRTDLYSEPMKKRR